MFSDCIARVKEADGCGLPSAFSYMLHILCRFATSNGVGLPSRFSYVFPYSRKRGKLGRIWDKLGKIRVSIMVPQHVPEVNCVEDP